MRRIAVIAAAIIAAFILIALIAPNFIPEAVYRERIIEAVRASTGRDLKIAGDIDLSIFPTLRVKASGVSLSNAQGFGSDQFASMKQLEAGVKLLPLLGKKVEFTRFILVDPTIALEIDEQGHNNWTFESTEGKGEKKAAEPEKTAEPAKSKGGAAIGDVNLGKIELVNGLVTYADRQKGEHWEARNINITVTLESLDKPLEVDGAAVWKGRKVAVELNADNPRGLMTAAGSALKLKVNSDLFDVKFDGKGASDKAMTVTGAADLDVKSVRDLIAWVGEPLAKGDGFGPLKLSGNVSYGDGKAAFENAKIKFDNIEGEGAINIDTTGDKPYLKGALKVDTLDVTPYMAKDTKSEVAPSSGDAASGAAPAQGDKGWSTAPIDLSSLRAANADFNFEAKKVLIDKIKLADSVIAAQLKNGILNVDLSKLSLYGGTGLAKIKLDGSTNVPKIATDLNFQSIAVEPLLTDAASFTRLSGTGNLTLNITATGTSQKAMAQSVGGNGSLKLTDGAIKGINLAAMVRNISGAFVTGPGSTQQTDFAELSGTYQIVNGVLANKDLQLLNPLLRIAGAGTADIGARTVNYTVVPKAVASTEGQGGKNDLTGISVPVKITGSWDNLKFAPDPKALLENALTGFEGAKSGGTDPLKGALKGLIGQPPETKSSDDGKTSSGDAKSTDGETTTAPATEDPAQKLLKGILGGQ